MRRRVVLQGSDGLSVLKPSSVGCPCCLQLRLGQGQKQLLRVCYMAHQEEAANKDQCTTRRQLTSRLSMCSGRPKVHTLVCSISVL
jgi:hypothetical protein